MASSIKSNTYLDEHQKQVLTRLQKEENPSAFILWNKMGSGKTRLALWAFEYSGFTDLIVICRRVSFGDWIEEMKVNGLDYMVFEDGYDLINLRLTLPNRLKPNRRMLLFSGGDLKNFPSNYPKGQMLVIDELYLFGNSKAKRSQKLQQISPFCSAVLGLSGTIMPSQDNATIFGQCMAVGIHRVLARTLTEFRTRFQDAMQTRFGRQTKNKSGSNKQIKALLEPYIDVYMPESRPTRTQIIKVKPLPEQKAALKELKDNYEFKNIEYKYTLQIVLVAAGISNGWFVNESGGGHLESSKVDRLKAILEELKSEGEKAVIWCAYHNDIERIARSGLFSFCRFTGRDDFDEKGWKEGKYNFCLATESMGASVNYFADVQYAIYFSINFKLLDLQQSMARHERKNSQHSGAHYYFLQTEGTPDVRAYHLVTQSHKSEQELVKTLKNELLK